MIRRRAGKKPKKGQTVLVTAGEFGAKYGKYTRTGEVEDLLSTQFTAVVDGKVEFFKYTDHGLTWALPED